MLHFYQIALVFYVLNLSSKVPARLSVLWINERNAERANGNARDVYIGMSDRERFII